MENKKIYFASDQHFGVPNLEKSHEREKLFVKWLDMVQKDAEHIFLLGDLFDFWFEYKTVVPRGYTRVLGKLAQITDSGIPVTFFVGNHDLWMTDYFKTELGITVLHQPKIFDFFGKKFFIGHGDGLGPYDTGYKRMKKVFVHPFSKWLYARLHPNLALGLANYFSKKSRLANGNSDQIFLGEDKEWLIKYAERKLESNSEIDYFLFGHRHLSMDIKLSTGAKYINTGEWVNGSNYAVFEDGDLQLKSFVKK